MTRPDASASEGLRPPEPVIVRDRFPEERAALLDLLGSLTPEEWDAPTACAGWSVKDIAAHLLADDLGRLSRGRDGFRGHGPRPGEALLAFIDRQNAEWVIAARRLSPRVLMDLLGRTGAETHAWFASLDPFALGGPVSWAGPEPAPVWLDLAREYTERWHHQQHIRDAVGAPSLTAPRLFAPVLATFVHALPETFRHVASPGRTVVALRITGESGGDWAVVGGRTGWTLFAGTSANPATRVTLDQETRLAPLHQRHHPGTSRAARRHRGRPGIGRDPAPHRRHHRLSAGAHCPLWRTGFAGGCFVRSA